MSQDDKKHTPDPGVKHEGEISNVDLQFMGTPDVRREMRAEEKAEAKLADEFSERGLDPQDVASAGSMIASDPASPHVHPGDHAESNDQD